MLRSDTSAPVVVKNESFNKDNALFFQPSLLSKRIILVSCESGGLAENRECGGGLIFCFGAEGSTKL